MPYFNRLKAMAKEKGNQKQIDLIQKRIDDLEYSPPESVAIDRYLHADKD